MDPPSATPDIADGRGYESEYDLHFDDDGDESLKHNHAWIHLSLHLELLLKFWKLRVSEYDLPHFDDEYDEALKYYHAWIKVVYHPTVISISSHSTHGCCVLFRIICLDLKMP